MDNYFNLSGHRVFVAGAAGSLGGATARALAALGAELILVDQHLPDILHKEVLTHGVTAEAHALDNTVRKDVDRLVAQVGRIDALVDCSGCYHKGDWVGDEGWDDLLRSTLEINVSGPVNLVRAILPTMMARQSGRIALTTSMAARNAGTTLAVDPAYVASKGALQSLVRFFARQAAASGVVVNAIAPGPIGNPMTESARQPWDVGALPMRRLGKPEEVGWPLAFLCTKATGFMTGVVIDVNSGIHFS
jgi:NAD(P)-dependent dehydrogenase (short-subunit alcohol dehydrogenase family)